MHPMTDHRERRRFLANAARLVVASLLGGPLSTFGRSPIAVQAAGAAAPILAVGGGAFATEAVLLRGCSALSTGVAGVGGALPRGLSVDFRRSIACLISGVDRHTIEVRSTDSVLSAAPGAD